MLGRRTVLLVEDEESITVPLQEALAREGFDASVAGTAAQALELARSLEPDVVLLDVMLPDGSGFDVCRELRRESSVPIIMVTARGEEADRVVGLELGADDYVTKPFSAREVVARIRAVLRRAEPRGATAGRRCAAARRRPCDRRRPPHRDARRRAARALAEGVRRPRAARRARPGGWSRGSGCSRRSGTRPGSAPRRRSTCT